MEFKTIKEYARAETVERKSRFIAEAQPVETEEAARAFIEERKVLFNDATHVCFAYVLGAGGENFRSYDAGEPGGTAGAPILNAIKKGNLTGVVLTVTRYFGGIKLGMGGLSAAYAKSAVSVLECTETVIKKLCSVFNAVCSYADFEALKYSLRATPHSIISVDYAQEVSALIAVQKEFKNALAVAAAGKFAVTEIKEGYIVL
ncbi:MAG: YigZ family protein [Christensenellaceae bacterium]|jgi:uncharacterized YigZ family protein|nr:YigZ family protein [Christensenellaceae bacterium]